jgi:hypothetical protein
MDEQCETVADFSATDVPPTSAAFAAGTLHVEGKLQ